MGETLSSAGPFTVFAPSNEGFAKIASDTLDKLLKAENKDVLVELLTNHVVAGVIKSSDLNDYGLNYATTVSGGKLSGLYSPKTKGLYARICVVSSRGLGCQYLTEAGSNNLASNGIVHIIGGVLVPDYGQLTLENKVASADIVGLAQSVPDLSTLVAAVVAGDLVDTLTSAGPFTVLAPTNEGFAALPAGTVESLLKPENKATLVDILTAFQEVPTVEGKKLHITGFGGVVKVGASLASKDLKTVTAADNLASNGVVHIINGVMLPPSSYVVV